MPYSTSEQTPPGLWRCKNEECRAILGAYTRAGHLWLAAEVVDLAQRYANMVRVECKCGQVNRFYFKRNLRSALDSLEHM